MKIEECAPAKINLTLHVTGRREDGYHTLDSLVMFADIGDRVVAEPADEMSLRITGPMGTDLPADDNNLVIKAARATGTSAALALDKTLPVAAGIGGGSADAAATLRALARLGGTVPDSATCRSIGADVPVCLLSKTARMQGVGDVLQPLDGLPALHAVLVNPNLPVMTAQVFAHLTQPDNDPMPETLPSLETPSDLISWLSSMRNDLEAPAMQLEPSIGQVFEALEVTPGCRLARMSGSGGTCFGLYHDAETAQAAAGRLQESHPGWWVVATVLNRQA